MTRLLLDEYPLIVLPRLACAIGLNEAMILQQLHYWLGKSNHEHKGRRWVYNTYEQWQEQFPFWSIPTIRRAISSLSKPYTPKSATDGRVGRGALLLIDRFNVAGFDKTNWYTIDYDTLGAVEGMIRRSDQNDQTIGSKRSDGSDQFDQTNTRDYQRQQTEKPVDAVGLMSDQLTALEALTGLGVDPTTARKLAGSCAPGDVVGWVEYARKAQGLDNAAGLVVARLRAGEPAPDPGGDGDGGRRRFIEGEFAEFVQH